VHAEADLAGWATAGEIAVACRRASGPDRDRILSALLRVAAGDEMAQLTVVAGVADRLASVVGGWGRAGVPATDLAVMEVDLVAECWVTVARLAAEAAAGGHIPPNPGLKLVDAAREAVRVPRRRERRAATRQVPLSDSYYPAAIADPRSAADRLAAELGDAVRHRRVSLAAVRPVFLTRVAGLDVPEAARQLGCTPGVLRAIRSRAERRLAA